MISDRLARGLSEFRDVTLTDSYDALASIFGGTRSLAGARVNSHTALTVSAYYAGVKILAETMGSMPCEVMKWKGEDESRVALPDRKNRLWPLLYEKPNPEMHAGDFWEIVTTHIALRGNAFIYKQRDEYDRVVALWPIVPHRVEVQRDLRTRRKKFLVSTDAEDAVVLPFQSTDMLHLRGFGSDPLRGLSPIGVQRELLGRAIAEQDYQSSLMANQARPSGVLRTDGKVDPKKGRLIARRFQRANGGYRRAGGTIILEQGLQWQATSLSSADAQFIEQREFSTKDVTRILRLPADMMLVETGSSMHYTSDETVPLRFLTFTMMPWIRRVEGPISIDQDLPWTMAGVRSFPRFQPDVLLRVDRATRFEAWALALDRGWMTPDEVRVREGLPPLGLNKTKPIESLPSKEKRELSAGDEEPEVTPDDVERLLALT